MPKYRIIRALMGMKHSPAGKKYLESQAKKKADTSKKVSGKTKPTYFKGKAFERPTIESRLKAAGLSESDLRSLRGKKK